MDSPSETIINLPSPDFASWEELLTRRLLMVGPSGDAWPIRSFEVTPEVICQATGLHVDRCHEALASFKSAVCGPRLLRALEEGAVSPGLAPGDVPGFFAYLVLTVLVASMPDTDGDRGGDFRRKLREFTGIDRSFNDLRGVAILWRKLVAWLDGRRAAGRPFRELILPAVPASWPHIGYTLRLAFPLKTDATLLSNFLAAQPEIIGQPRIFIDRFQSYKAIRPWSEGMLLAFENFRTELLTGNRLLADHPFWRLATSCAPRDAALAVDDAHIECVFEQDGSPTFSVALDDGTKVAGPMDLSQAVARLRAHGRSRLGALALGFLPFVQEGYGKWSSALSVEDAVGRIRIGCSQVAHACLRGHRDLFSPSGEWFFSTEPMTAGRADECARLLGWSPTGDAAIAAIQVVDGVRTGGRWLGRPRFLPHVLAAGYEVVVRAGDQSCGVLTTVQDAHALSAVRLLADEPVDGSWIVEPVAARGWSKQVTFVGSCYPHEDLECAASAYPVLSDWVSVGTLVKENAAFPETWDEERRATPDDLVEAVYAGGRSGWDEGDLIRTIQHAHGGEVNPWVILRLLRDSTLIRPRLRPLWRGRVWTLRPPVLRRVEAGLVVEGAICDRQSKDFRAVSLAFGGAPFKRYADISFSPALFGCVGGDVQEIADRLAWPIVDDGRCGDARMAFADTSMVLLGRTRKEEWDWGSRRFAVKGQSGDGFASLSRWELPGGNDHDIYVVRHAKLEREWRSLSRVAAVCFAHWLSGVSLFDCDDGVLVGQVSEAGLPDAVASRLRLGRLANPGLRDGRQSYPIDTRDLSWLLSVLPGLVTADDPVANRLCIDAVSVARHSRGRIRLRWERGSLSIPSAASNG